MARPIEQPPTKPHTELAPISVIRTETALSRYPIHRLAKRGNISIEIVKKDAKGATILAWEVSHNARYGQPGPLAYKIDTIVINRRIEEEGRPVPKIVRLGSIRDICRMLNMSEGEATQQVKRALRQNVGALISAKVTYKTIDKGERTLEADFNRYSVIFTGETMPDGRKADAVYVILNDIYIEVLNNALTRPLDYDYIRDLPPAAQRFYEILSYQMVPAVRYNQRAKIAYSEYCLLSTQTRYFDFTHVKKQMWKIHRVHVQHGYIGAVHYQATTDEERRPDWYMLYVPGDKARNDQLAFSFEGKGLRKGRRKGEDEKSQDELQIAMEPETLVGSIQPTAAPPQDQSADRLVRHFYQTFHASADTAHPSPKELDQARDLLDRLGEEQAAYLVEFSRRAAKETKFSPQTFGGILQYEARAMAEYQQTQERRERAKRGAQTARLKAARDAHEERYHAQYQDYLREMDRRIREGDPDSYRAFEESTARKRAEVCTGPVRPDSGIGKRMLERFDREEQHLERLREFFRDAGVLDFWQWDATLNPDRFQEPPEA